MKKRIFALAMTWSLSAHAQTIPVTLKAHFPHTPERLMDLEAKQTILGQKPELMQLYTAYRQQIKGYVEQHAADSTWMPSRLQMYWNSRSTAVYIRGGVYAHAEGQAPVPTVRFPGARDHVTVYAMPKLEDMLPYEEDPRGIRLINRSKPGQPIEWADPAKTGRIIESINNHIIGLAYRAAFVYWLSGEEEYARFASDVFDTYMRGMQYRNAPTDLNYGHHSTIAGLSTFEVIQEVAILKSLTGAFKCLYPYLLAHKKNHLTTYEAVFKKWAEVQITHGVAFNNWNLMEAMNVINIASILGPDRQYSDGKGAEYYLDQILNKGAERQWSLQKSLKYGFDPLTGLWNESPGYATMVTGDFTGFVQTFDELFDMDILDHMPILEQAVMAPAQYLFPNGYISAFGDSYYRQLTATSALQLIAHAQKRGKRELEVKLTRYVKALENANARWKGDSFLKWNSGAATNLTLSKPFALDPQIPAGDLREYSTPVAYSPKVSYFAQRNGDHPKYGLMAAAVGSKGNHMHANGISMEFFGKGYVLGPDAGIGTSYFSNDYLEYYSRFPAHNTVAVDGISNYPEMKSNHGFSLKGSFPQPGIGTGNFEGITFGDLHFLEPETQADQRRFTATVRINDQAGYYLDVFRSARKDGEDKFHDYFYHNIGQSLEITGAEMQPTQKLSFSGGHLFAYDYLYDKYVGKSTGDIKALFTLAIPERETVFMNVWMNGAQNREVFSVKAPQTKSYRGNVMLPDSVVGKYTPTLVVRQSGEAWFRPFVAVYEPATATEPSAIAEIKTVELAQAPKELVVLDIHLKDGRVDRVYQAANGAVVNNDFEGNFGLVRSKEGKVETVFLGQGKMLAAQGFRIHLQEEGAAVLHFEGTAAFIQTSVPCILEVPEDRKWTSITVNGQKREVKGKKSKGKYRIELPKLDYQKIKD